MYPWGFEGKASLDAESGKKRRLHVKNAETFFVRISWIQQAESTEFFWTYQIWSFSEFSF